MYCFIATKIQFKPPLILELFEFKVDVISRVVIFLDCWGLSLYIRRMRLSSCRLFFGKKVRFSLFSAWWGIGRGCSVFCRLQEAKTDALVGFVFNGVGDIGISKIILISRNCQRPAGASKYGGRYWLGDCGSTTPLTQ